jgi:hypothetical protein
MGLSVESSTVFMPLHLFVEVEWACAYSRDVGEQKELKRKAKWID